MNEELLMAWNSLKYYSEPAPKSLDASFFFREMLPEINIDTREAAMDNIRTLYEHIAFQLNEVISDKQELVLTTGGGAMNEFLISLIREKYQLNLHFPDETLIKFKEAVIFAFMGLLRLRGEVNVLSSVTGSAEDHSAGKLDRGGAQ